VRDDDYRQYLEWLQYYSDRYLLKIWAYCLMNNHVHFVAVPGSEESVPRLTEALARLATGGIDLVLTDLGLPDSQGLATFRELRQAAPDLAIIVVTVSDDQEMAVAAVREGAQDFLVKGQISGNLLVRAVRYAIERKRTERH